MRPSLTPRNALRWRFVVLAATGIVVGGAGVVPDTSALASSRGVATVPAIHVTGAVGMAGATPTTPPSTDPTPDQRSSGTTTEAVASTIVTVTAPTFSVPQTPPPTSPDVVTTPTTPTTAVPTSIDTTPATAEPSTPPGTVPASAPMIGSGTNTSATPLTNLVISVSLPTTVGTFSVLGPGAYPTASAVGADMVIEAFVGGRWRVVVARGTGSSWGQVPAPPGTTEIRLRDTHATRGASYVLVVQENPASLTSP